MIALVYLRSSSGSLARMLGRFGACASTRGFVAILLFSFLGLASAATKKDLLNTKHDSSPQDSASVMPTSTLDRAEMSGQRAWGPNEYAPPDHFAPFSPDLKGGAGGAANPV